MGSALYRSIRASCSSSIQFILKNVGNYVRFANMQKPFYAAHTFSSVFALKTDKLWFVTNDMWTIRGNCSAGSQSHPHIHAFVRKWLIHDSSPITMCSSEAFPSTWNSIRNRKVHPMHSFWFTCVSCRSTYVAHMFDVCRCSCKAVWILLWLVSCACVLLSVLADQW